MTLTGAAPAANRWRNGNENQWADRRWRSCGPDSVHDFGLELGEPLYVPETDRVLIDNLFAAADLMSVLADGSGAVTLFR
jgi:hypothetical protein